MGTDIMEYKEGRKTRKIKFLLPRAQISYCVREVQKFSVADTLYIYYAFCLKTIYFLIVHTL